jgi:GNAT superfamily N-acetyltransferase
MVIREVGPSEYKVVGDLTVAAYEAIPGDHMSGGYEQELRAVDRRAVEAVVLVAEVDGVVVGAVTYVPDPSSPWAEELGADEAGIRMLAVDPTRQAGGVGSALVEACIERARSEDKRAVFLHTTPWMATAHRLYQRRGFVRVPDRDWLPVPEVPLMAYRLAL